MFSEVRGLESWVAESVINGIRRRLLRVEINLEPGWYAFFLRKLLILLGLRRIFVRVWDVLPRFWGTIATADSLRE